MRSESNPRSAWLAQSEVCDSCSQGYEFKPHIGCRDYLKIKSLGQLGDSVG